MYNNACYIYSVCDLLKCLVKHLNTRSTLLVNGKNTIEWNEKLNTRNAEKETETKRHKFPSLYISSSAIVLNSLFAIT